MEKSKQPADMQVEMVPLDWSTVDHIRAISGQAYPSYFQTWEKNYVLDMELIMRGVLDLSFLIRDENGRFCGYCIAFLIESEVVQDDVISMYVADVAVLPDAQGAHVGLAIAQEALARADKFSIERIEFEARESTTYRALFASSHTQQVLEEYGYTLRDHAFTESIVVAGEVREVTRSLSLQKIITTVDV